MSLPKIKNISKNINNFKKLVTGLNVAIKAHIE